MPTEDLLKPRYRVIADWPGNTKYEIGDILKGYSPGCGGGDLILNDKGESVWLSPENFPILFKELFWWEYRKPEDMPEYVIVKYREKDYYIKVESWIEGGYFKTKIEGIEYLYYASGSKPITKEEYENQK